MVIVFWWTRVDVVVMGYIFFFKGFGVLFVRH